MPDEYPGEYPGEDPGEDPAIEPTVEMGDDSETVEPGTTDAARAGAPSRISTRSELPFGLIAFLLIAVLLVVFTVQNSNENVVLKFLVWEGSYPLALIIIGVVTVTVILDEVLGLFLRQRRRRRLAEKEELKRLRGMNR